jgi:hypothetical protein
MGDPVYIDCTVHGIFGFLAHSAHERYIHPILVQYSVLESLAKPSLKLISMFLKTTENVFTQFKGIESRDEYF